MTQAAPVTRVTTKTQAQAIIGRCKNGPRLVVWMMTPDAKREIKDVPADGVNAAKIEAAYPRQVIGVYTTQCKPEWLEADINAVMKVK